MTAPYKNPNAQALYRQYKKSSRKRGLLFDLPYETFVDVTQHECYLCGTEPSQVYVHDKKKKSYVNNPFTYNGLDRVINEIGYQAGNLASCCGTCNFAKKFVDIEAFLTYIKRAYDFNFKRSKKRDKRPAKED